MQNFNSMNSFQSFSPESSLRSQSNLPYGQQLASIMSLQDIETLQSFFTRNSIEQSFREFDEKTSLFYENRSFFEEKPKITAVSQEKLEEKFNNFPYEKTSIFFQEKSRNSKEKSRNSKEKPRISPEYYEDSVLRSSLLTPYRCKPWSFPKEILEDDGFNSLMQDLDNMIKRATDNVKATEKFLQDYNK